MSGPERFHIHSPHEIADLLRNMQEDQDRLRLRFADSAETMIARIREVDEKNARVFLECAASPLQNAIALSSRAIRFEAVLGRVRIVFRVNRLRKARYGDRAALVMDLPESVVRYQRRESVRIPLEAAFIHIPPGEKGKGKMARGRVHDIGTGGITVVDEAQMMDDGVNAVYSGCTLFLPQMPPLTVNLRFRNVMEIRGDNPPFARRIGCQFVNLADEAKAEIARFVAQAERKIRLDAAGEGA